MSGQIRWVVKPGDGARVVDVLAKAGEGVMGAADEGRAFVNGRRATAEDAIAAGDEVVIWSARCAVGDEAEVRVLARWGEIVAAYKPPALPTTPDRRGDRSLVLELAKLLRAGEGSRELGGGGRASAITLPHAASRLDVGVSGVVLCAIGPRGLAQIEAMRAARRLRRTYVAVASGLLEGAGMWDAPIGQARAFTGRWRPSIGGRTPEQATTHFRALAWARPCSAPGSALSSTLPAAPVRADPSGARGKRETKAPQTRSTLLLVEPVTGRMHQIRVHASFAGAPLVGDREHGGPRSLVDAEGRVHSVTRIGLHAFAVELPGPNGERLRAEAQVPADLRLLWKILDGPEGAWNDVSAPPLTGEAG